MSAPKKYVKKRSAKLLIFTATLIAFLSPQKKASASKIIAIDGSSTVYPITEAVAEEFGVKDRSMRVTVGVSGTGGGFKKFCRGETVISNASRIIKQKEIALCNKNGVDFIELPVAYDGLAVVINKKNSWAKTITTSELKKIWQPEAQKSIIKWSQIRSGWPNKPIHLFGPGVDSGTFDYFTKTIVGKSQASRGDYTSSEDDNVLVQGVSRDQYALGYFGLAYYTENKNILNAAAIDAGNGAILPSVKTVEDGTYAPLSRPLFIYVSKNALNRPEVSAFMNFYMENSRELSSEVGYVALPLKTMDLVSERLNKKITGTMYSDKSKKGKPLDEFLKN